MLFGRIALVIVALALTLVVIGLAGALREPHVVTYRVAVAGLYRPLRLILVGDIHGSPITMSRARLDRIVAQVNALRPDIVVLAGDYDGGLIWDPPGGRLEDALEPLSALRARHGVFAVLGNHDQPYWTRRLFARAPVPRLLVNAHARAGPVTIAGIDDWTNAPDPARATRGAPTDRPLIVVGHEPWFRTTLRADTDLFLAGHTHGGQVRLPLLGRPVEWVGWRERVWRGLAIGGEGRPMIVTSGVGTSILPLRIGVPPEIVLVTLTPA